MNNLLLFDEYASSPFASEVGVAVLELRLIRIV
jgi:hypothetical protein